MKKWTLNQGLRLFSATNRKLCFIGNTNQKLLIPKSEEGLLRFLSTGLKTEKEIKDWMLTHHHEWSFEKITNSDFVTEHFVDPKNQDSSDEVFINLISGNQTKIKDLMNKTILIFSANGISSHLIHAFARMNITKIVVVDEKIVQENDLNSSALFDRNDIGKYKVEAIKNKVALFSDTEIIPISKTPKWKNEFIDLKNNYEIDFVIISSDSQAHIQKFSYECFSINNIPITMCGHINTLLVSGPILDRRSEAFEMIINQSSEGADFHEREYENSILATNHVLNATLASYTSNEILRYWIGHEKSETYEARIQIDFVTSSKQKHSL